jgi:stage III sporulation protein AC
MLIEPTIIFRIAAIGLVTIIICQVQEKAGKGEMATFTMIAGSLVVVGIVAKLVIDMFNAVQTVFQF